MKWVALLPLWFIFNALAYLLGPLLPLFARDRIGPADNNHFTSIEPRLPGWLAWFMTPDNSLCGDRAFAGLHPESYWSMVLWLWRNPACGFEAGPLGARLGMADHVDIDGDPLVQDGPAGREGYCLTSIAGYWNLVRVKRLGSRCLKVDLGWQLKTYAEDQARLLTQPTARYAMSIRFPRFIQ